MIQNLIAIPGLAEQPVEGEQSKLARRFQAQHPCRFEEGRYRHRVPAGVERAVDEGRGALGAGGQQRLAGFASSARS